MASNRPVGVDGPLFKQALLGSLSWLSANHEEVNRLNVFPVPDGDTGTNMLLTLQSAVEDIKDSNAAEVSKIAKLASHGSLMGARGNSGVILSQIFRGFARAVEGKSSLTPRELAAAFEEAANAAYRAVNKPTEGTILTVAREAGRAADRGRRQPGCNRAERHRRGRERRARRGPEDAEPAADPPRGGRRRRRRFRPPDNPRGHAQDGRGVGVSRPRPTQATAKPPPSQVALELPEGGWGYCTEFLIEGSGLDMDVIRNQIEALGNSVLVVGEPELVKVHVHTDDPTRVITLAGGHGKLLKLNVGDMSTQHKRILEGDGVGLEAATAEWRRARCRGGGQGPGRDLSRPGRRRDRRGRPVDEPEHAGHAHSHRVAALTTRSSCFRTTATSFWPPSR